MKCERGLALFVSGVLLLAALPTAAGGQLDGTDRAPALTTEVRFDIAPQSLDAALVAFARASGVDVMHDNDVSAGRTTTGVSGMLAPFQALEQLLAGTGLKPLFVSAHAVIVVNELSTGAPRESLESNSVLTLNTLEVRDVAPRLGGHNYEHYARAVRFEIERYLRAIGRNEAPRFTAIVKIWIALDGRIARVEWDRGSGSVEIDRAIELQLQTAHVARPPSQDMPQPLRFEVRRD